MDIVIRYGEIGTKSGRVRSRLANTLRQRIEDRLEYEALEYSKVSRIPGRIIAREVNPDPEIVEEIALMPGVQSCSKSYSCGSNLNEIKETLENIEIGETFGVRANTKQLDSQNLEEEIGDYLLGESREVDLDDPETWIRIDERAEEAFVFTDKLEGPGGFPVASEGDIAALISGGIDSPVAAYRLMTRGTDITPLYFYNRPFSAEDHILRFQQSLEELRKFHPAKEWSYYLIDMEDANKKLEEIGSGRMVIHRRLMFRVAERIAKDKDLDGIMTGESMGQKSSQTPQNLKITSKVADLPIHRPLISRSKSDITSEARNIGTYQYSKIRSACRDISPGNPSTSMDLEKVEELESRIKADKLVEKLYSSVEKKNI